MRKSYFIQLWFLLLLELMIPIYCRPPLLRIRNEDADSHGHSPNVASEIQDVLYGDLEERQLHKKKKEEKKKLDKADLFDAKLEKKTHPKGLKVIMEAPKALTVVEVSAKNLGGIQGENVQDLEVQEKGERPVHDPKWVRDFYDGLQEEEDMWFAMAASSMSMTGGVTETCRTVRPEFIAEGDASIGAQGTGGEATDCGVDCFDVQDSLEGTPPDTQDSLHFVYDEVTSTVFTIVARVCGVGCTNEVGSFCGRMGLMVRESLEPGARNVFVSIEPFRQLQWSTRINTGGSTVLEFEPRTPAEECMFVELRRLDNQRFDMTFDYQADPPCGRCCLDPNSACNSLPDVCELRPQVTIPGMPDTVLVGLAVASRPLDDYRDSTAAQFTSIEFQT